MAKSALSQKLLKYYFKQFGAQISAYGPKIDQLRINHRANYAKPNALYDFLKPILRYVIKIIGSNSPALAKNYIPNPCLFTILIYIFVTLLNYLLNSYLVL